MAISAPMIEAALFDLDDLMVNSSPLHFEASRRVFRPLGIDIDQIPDEMIAGFFGMRVTEILELTADYFGVKDKIDLKDLNERRQVIFVDLVKVGVEPMPGLYALTDTVKKLRLKRGVASSGTKLYIKATLEVLKLKKYFSTITSGDMVARGKPYPDIFLKAAESLNVLPAKCVVFEDSTAGVTAAKAAGMYCIGVDNSISKYKQDISHADIVVPRLDKIDAEMLKQFI